MKFVSLTILLIAGSLSTVAQNSHYNNPSKGGEEKLFEELALPSQEAPSSSSSFDSTDPYSIVEAENFHAQSGVQILGNNNAQGVGFVNEGDFIRFDNASFLTGPFFGGIRASSATNGGVLEFRMGSVDGPLLGTAEITNTGGWAQTAIFPIDVFNQELYTSGNGCLGNQTLYLVATGPGTNLIAIDKFKFLEANVPVEEVILFNCPEEEVILGDELFFGGSIVPPCPTIPVSLFSVDVGEIGPFAGDYIAETLGEITVTLTSVSNPEITDECTFTVVEPEGLIAQNEEDGIGTNFQPDFNKPAYSVFPNPIKNEFRISNPTNNLVRIRLTSLAGEVLYEGSGREHHVIQTANLESGLYLVRIIDGEEIRQVRVLKE